MPFLRFHILNLGGKCSDELEENSLLLKNIGLIRMDTVACLALGCSLFTQVSTPPEETANTSAEEMVLTVIIKTIKFKYICIYHS